MMREDKESWLTKYSVINKINDNYNVRIKAQYENEMRVKQPTATIHWYKYKHFI